jgi:hypothetical protein
MPGPRRGVAQTFGWAELRGLDMGPIGLCSAAAEWLSPNVQPSELQFGESTSQSAQSMISSALSGAW